jgi:hypothetical protein
MALFYEITGYSRKTGHLEAYYDVPGRKKGSVKRIAGIGPSDDGLGSYPLNAGQVAEIARILETPIECPGCDFFLEPFEEPRQESR